MKNIKRIVWNELNGSVAFVFTIISVVLAIIAAIDIDSNFNYKFCISAILVGITALIFFVIYIVKTKKLRKTNNLTLKIGITKVNVFYGDIFSASNDGNKIIPVNEYYDTITDKDKRIIKPDSLHGIYLDNNYKTKESRSKLHSDIDKFLAKTNFEINSTRKVGYKKRYPLGTIYPDDDFYLLSFTKFDDDNRAYIPSYKDLVLCFLNMWNNIDILGANKNIYLPLIGSSPLSKINDVELSNQELLITMLETLKLSKVRISKSSSVNIVLYKKSEEDLGIDFVSIREKYKNH